MVKIYVKNADGQKVYVEVTEAQASAYREEKQKEWRSEWNEKYHTVSFDEMVEAGYDLADADSDIDRIFEEKDEIKRRKSMLKTLKKALQTLTPIQKQTVYKLFLKNMSQAEIACEEGVTRWSINDRVEGILHRLRKILEKKENFFEKTPPQALENSLISEGT